MNGLVIIDKPSGKTSHDIVAEVRALLKGQMAGREAYVRFFCLGPVNSA